MHRYSNNARRRLLAAATVAAAAAGTPWRTSLAQHVVRLLVGFPPGGAIDVTARVYAEAMRGVGTFVVENRAGAAGNIAATALAQSRPDASTVMLAPLNVYCISTALYRSLSFEPARDFAPVGIVATFPWVLAVHPDVPVRSVQEFIAWARARPEQSLCGMAAVGSEGHLMAFGFSRSERCPVTFVPYKGGAPMAQDLMAGHIPAVFDPIVNLAPAHKAGKVRILAVTSAERSALLPEVPTFAELGYSSAVGETWIGASVRQGVPASAVRDLSTALLAAGRIAAVHDKLAAIGLAARTQGPEAMAAVSASDTRRYAGLVRESGLKLD
ncbi:tripartite tricarboxylate transporter substrate binding protein [Pigmentiphaga sp. D-2]|uniref:Bug family tripartite tricarboxylate transporter substrate binding protein n=1 Tax=Pigmentiphaga sp. D-2 TaxID=1002116 RepID=UPI00104BBBD9|nr:tripartite tricarboxylate transporter substrate binding protein [Pigmentiphaga sp. D-2]